MELEEASTHKSAVTHADNVLWLVILTFDLRNKRGLMVDYVFVKPVDLRCIVFKISREKQTNKQTNTHINTVNNLPLRLPWAYVLR